tara:strand:- start:4000 stop:5373 length:1374 start_codon:yes stop_codon:yes gene_type:complete
MEKFFIVENGMISEDYIKAPNIECALKHTHKKYNKNNKLIGTIKIKRKEDLVNENCTAHDEPSLQNSLKKSNKCPNIYLTSDISINTSIQLGLGQPNIESHNNKHTLSVLENGNFVSGNDFQTVTFNNIILNVNKKANKTPVFKIYQYCTLTFSNSEINITNVPNIIKGETDSIVTIMDSSLYIKNIPPGITRIGIGESYGIESTSVNLENNHLIEFKNNQQLFHKVSNLTISNNNQFNYLDNSVGIIAKQINIISNKQMSFNNNNIINRLIHATHDTIDISNSNLLFYKNISDTNDGTLLWAKNDIIFDGGSLVALNNTSDNSLPVNRLIYSNSNIIFKNHPWFDISTNLSGTTKMSTNKFSGTALLAYNTNLNPTIGSNLDLSMDNSLCSYPAPVNCPTNAYNAYCFGSTSPANICIDTCVNILGMCNQRLPTMGCNAVWSSTIGCRCHMSPPSS